MTQAEPDRRVRRTKRRLKEALFELMEEGSFEGITVEEITRRADVGRSTFYSHFASKEELLFDGFDEWLHSLPHAPAAGPAARGGAEGFRFSLPLLEHIRSQRRFVETVVLQGSNGRIRRKTASLVAAVARQELERGSPPGSAGGGEAERLREARAHAVAGAFLGLVSWWLSAGKGMTPEAVDRVFQGVVTPPETPSPGGAPSPDGAMASPRTTPAPR